MDGNNYKLKKSRMFIVSLIIIAGITAVLFKLYDIQITNFKTYQDQAIQQQTGDIPISPQRGIIYDRNMKVLASNAPVEQVFISPVEIKNDDEAKLISQGLSEILGVDYEDIYIKTQKKNRKDENIKHNVEISVANKVREFKLENDIDAIYFRPETKRIYPYSNLAAQVIGFTGTDNEGRFGVEYQFDEYLKGVPGRIITAKNALGKSMNSEYSTYIDAQQGNNVILTIDWAIQNFLEKNLEAAFSESQPRERVTGIVMDVNTGEILAMATIPSFDLNNPGIIDPEIMQYINLDDKTLLYIENKEFESEEAREDEINLQKLFKLWNNKAITEPYEPGSTFKVITASMGLEEKVVKETDGFYCPGYYVVSGIRISCHLYGGHGSETFAEGLKESCNPVLMQTAERVGNVAFLKYFDAFGYNQKTGIDLPSEAGSITHKPENFRTVELATSSFGQRFKITPIQQLTGIAAVANGGKLVTPHVVKAIVDDDGNIIKSFDTEIKRMVISEDTSKRLSGILADGVANGGAARNAFVKGYDVAAKTGTSEKEVGTDARIGSCIAYAPADNPQVALIIIVDEPSVGSVYGGVIAAPYVSRTLADILPYLGIEPKYSEMAESYIVVKNYGMQKIANVKEDIISKGLKYTVVGDGEFVREQIPKAGSSLLKGGNIILYTDNIQEKETVEIPDVTGMTAGQANKRIIDAGLNINIIGAENMDSNAIALKQEPMAGEFVAIGTIVTVEFRHNSITD
ncbi:MAG: penicillin-binding transpeptidase domain-containing protein [Oscillospiraceae bacterium]|nr:penicillin-binding transpeptidase domain-containing protein [Oscillospiraceae bacterium]